MNEFAAIPVSDAADGEAMDDSELVSVLRSHEAQAIGYQPGGNDEISSQQERAINYYYGVMDDVPAIDEQSSAVDQTVSTVIDAALAAVLKPFVSSEETVSFAPRNAEDIEFAAQATEYVNYVFNCDNPGFQILHDWFKDALLTKLGVVKVWWEDTSGVADQREVPIEDELHGAMLRSQPDYMGEESGVAFFGTFKQDGRVKVQNVPPEEFRITPYSRSIETALYVAHVPTTITRSDLIEMGFDPEIVETLPAYGEDLSRTTLQMARYRDEKAFDNRAQSFHSSQDRIALRDEYIRLDYDGDGIAELRRIMRVEETVLLNEVIEHAPFAALCPVPMPHKVFGQSLADLAMQDQRVATVLLRQALDNLYKSNNPRPVIGDGAWLQDGSTADSLMDNAPGAAIQLKDVNQFRFDAVPFTAGNAFTMLEYVERQVEQRTGISQNGQGLDTNALRKSGQMTATEMAMMQGARNARIEMIARIFAETGVRRLFKLILDLVTRHQQEARIVRLRNKFVPMDPRGWPEFDVTISVGLGVGEKSEQIMQADSVIQTMTLLLQSPFASMVTPENAYNAVRRKFNAAGIKDVDQYLTEPTEENQQQEQPDPELVKAQAEAQMQAAKMQHEQQMAELRLQLSAQEQQQKQALAREQAAFEAELAQAKAEAEARLAQQKMAMEADLAARKMQIEAAIAMQKAEQEAEAREDAMDEGDDLPSNRPGGSLAE
jgi:hypothetical protein